jgi:hypothetical protein
MMSSEQHRARAKGLKSKNPISRAAMLHELKANTMDKRRRLSAKATKYLRRLNKSYDDVE